MNEKEYNDKLNSAYNLHTSGKYDDAKVIYEQLLQIYPSDINLLNLYAQLNVSLNNLDYAIELFNKIYDSSKIEDIKISIARVFIKKGEINAAIDALNVVSDKNTNKLKILAYCYNQQNQKKSAIECYNKLLEMNPNSYSDLYNISASYYDIKDMDNALEYGLRAYNINPKDYDLLFHISSVYIAKNEYKNALKYSLEALNIKITKNILFNTAIIYKNLNQDEEAVQYFDAVLQIEPDNKEALINIAYIYQNYDKNVSVDIYLKLHKLYPNDQTPLEHLYILYINMSKHQEALNTALSLIELDNQRSTYYSFAGDSYLELYKYEEAEKMYKKCSELKPNNEFVDLQLAVIYEILGRTDEAIVLQKKHIKDCKPAQIDYGYLMSRLRKNVEAREYYYLCHTNVNTEDNIINKAKKLYYKYSVQSKFGIDENQFMQLKSDKSKTFLEKNILNYQKKSWKDNDITGKKIIIYSAQGVGDMLMTSRYLNQVKKLTAEVTLQIEKSCISLFKYNFPDFKIISTNDEINLDDFDYTASFMELIYSLNIDFSKIEKMGNYISVPDSIVEEKSKLDVFKTDKKKVGIFWQGNPTVFMNRSINFECFKPLLELNNVLLYSFQISEIANSQQNILDGTNIINLKPYINCYEDTAALLKNIDLLVTIDTSIAHLAGAMGIKTYLLLPYAPEWRWFYDVEKTDWYESIRIFKQKEPGNWDAVISRVRYELSI